MGPIDQGLGRIARHAGGDAPELVTFLLADPTRMLSEYADS